MLSIHQAEQKLDHSFEEIGLGLSMGVISGLLLSQSDLAIPFCSVGERGSISQELS